MTKTRKGDRLPCVSTGLFTGPILGRVGAPSTLMAGGLLCCVGCIGSSLAPNIYVLIVCFGVLTGIVCFLCLLWCADRYSLCHHRLLWCADRYSLCHHRLLWCADRYSLCHHRLLWCADRYSLCHHRLLWCADRYSLCHHRLLWCADRYSICHRRLFRVLTGIVCSLRLL